MLAALLSHDSRDREPLPRIADGDGPAQCQRQGPLALLHRRPAVAYAAGDIRLVADARIDNRAELGERLGIAPDVLAGTTTPALIAAAYRRWGTDCGARLLGDFAFVLWDATRRRLLAARDPMGMRTLFHAQRGASLAVASSAAVLLELLDESPVVDRPGLAGWVVGRPSRDIPPLRGVESLPGGVCLVFQAGRATLQRFWQFDAAHALHYPGIAAYAEHLRELLGRCVSDRLPDDGTPVACQLSGGMDSTSVAAMAAEQLADPAHQLIAVSHIYRPNDRWDERELIGQTAAHLGIAHRLLLPVQPFTGIPYPELYPPLLDSPGTVVSPRYLDELRRVRDRGARVLLTGSGGDEMTWGHGLSYSRRLLRGELGVIGEVLAGAREHGLPLTGTLLNLFFRPLVPDAVRRARRRLRRGNPWPDWMPDSTARELALDEALFADPPAHFSNPAVEARYRALSTTSTCHSVRSFAAAGARLGVSVRHPFFDRRLAEFSFAIPDDLWLRERYPKWLLRKAMDGRLPDSVNWNRRKVVFDHFFAQLLKQQHARIRAILSHGGLQDLGLIDNRRVLAALDTALGRDPPTIGVDLLHVLMAQVWFQRYFDSPAA